MENKKFKWYMVAVAANREKQAMENLKLEVKLNNMTEYIEDYLVPTERRVIISKGKKINRESLVFNGYVMVKMLINGELLRVIKRAKFVQNVVSMNNIPTPLSDAEVERILSNIETSHSEKTYLVGDGIKILEGVFATFNGTVINVDQEKNELSVSIMILGKETPIKIEIDKCEKIN